MQLEAQPDVIVAIPTGAIGKQAIGNCWAYTTTAWLEALQLQAGSARVDYSESYLSYWNMYEALMGNRSHGLAGGSFLSASRIINQRGLMLQSDFINEQATGEESLRQQLALDNVEAWKKAGGLERAPAEDLAKRRYIRAALDKAWGLSDRRKAALDRAFGADVSRTMASANARSYSSFLIYRAADLPVVLYQPGASEPRKGRLSELVSASTESFSGADFRAPTSALVQVAFPMAGDPPLAGWSGFPTGYYLATSGNASVATPRALWKKMQRVLHQGIPIWGAWWMDKVGQNPTTGNFSQVAALTTPHAVPLGAGAHASLFVDYQAGLADGTALKAGQVASAAMMSAALNDSTSIQFFRIQNSWGVNPVWRDRPAGLYDLSIEYLTNLANQQCPETANPAAISPNCKADPFFGLVMLPLNVE